MRISRVPQTTPARVCRSWADSSPRRSGRANDRRPGVPEDTAVEHVQEQQTEKWSGDSRLDECAVSSAYGNRLLACRRDGEAAGVSDESETIGGALRSRLRTADEYRQSLRDARRVFYRGVAVEDVTTHPVFAHAVDHAALDYEMAHSERYAWLGDPARIGHSRYFHVPQNAEDLLARSALIEASTRAGKTLVLLIKESARRAVCGCSRSAHRWENRPQLANPVVLRALPDGDLAVCALHRPTFRGIGALSPSQQPNPDAT